MAFTLPKLPYEFGALEPYLDAKTMEIHHDKHHGTYVEKLNGALVGKKELGSKTVEELLGDLEAVPSEIRAMVRNHGGGHYNHSLFWTVMKPGGGGEPKGKLAEAVKAAFGETGKFREEFTGAAMGVFGSGWAWLTVEGGSLHVCSTPNQDNPVMKGNTPILGLDVWEHAYYLKYQNRRAEYVEAWWEVVNWEEVERRYKEAMD